MKKLLVFCLLLPLMISLCGSAHSLEIINAGSSKTYRWPLFGILKGTVYDEVTREPISGVIVRVKDKRTSKPGVFIQDVSNDQGAYLLKVRLSQFGGEVTDRKLQEVENKVVESDFNVQIQKKGYDFKEIRTTVGFKYYFTSQDDEFDGNLARWEKRTFETNWNDMPHKSLDIYIRPTESTLKGVKK